ncbi:nucleoside-diphosphate-sugar epimerase [Kutzneria buriramensis]|uniref:Nucleoside-diphosphate-sugar epimerase n=2 Tax=Kutzneria buriramensis TaxID=1045776 RepID=A0A3E0H4I8_9PSEU|nr:nucleoside-diphosphate-sugar epimerase [Kutzneria buriramensis]
MVPIRLVKEVQNGMRRVLVLGAAGFLGRHVSRRLAHDRDLTVITLGRSPLAASPWHISLDLGVCGPDAIGSMLQAVMPDVVVNCAGVTNGDPAAMVAGNVTATSSLVEALLDSDMPIRLVHLGCSAEYGIADVGRPINEDAPVRPEGAYGVTKLAATRLVMTARTAGLEATVLRVFSAIGPGMSVDSVVGPVVTEIGRAAGTDGDVVLGPLDVVRDFVDARDVAGAVEAAVTAASLDWPVVNVGSGCGVPLRTLADTMTRIVGLRGEIRESEDTPGPAPEIPWQQADVTIAARSLGWRPRIGLATSLADLWCSTM